MSNRWGWEPRSEAEAEYQARMMKAEADAAGWVAGDFNYGSGAKTRRSITDRVFWFVLYSAGLLLVFLVGWSVYWLVWWLFFSEGKPPTWP